jgi:hypothetical protein
VIMFVYCCTHLHRLQICSLCPLNQRLSSAWFCPSPRLGLLVATWVWRHLLLFHLRLRLLNFW